MESFEREDHFQKEKDSTRGSSWRRRNCSRRTGGWGRRSPERKAEGEKKNLGGRREGGPQILGMERI